MSEGVPNNIRLCNRPLAVLHECRLSPPRRVQQALDQGDARVSNMLPRAIWQHLSPCANAPKLKNLARREESKVDRCYYVPETVSAWVTQSQYVSSSVN
jgi:hypothetical protein